ncbi:MAG: EVE domain-containing protein [Bacillota bacterium]
MAEITLGRVLSLVGKLDDSPGEGTPRERFRDFLRETITDLGQLRDYVEECLRTPGDQYSRALQDLVNRLGELMGFQVTYGRYQGAKGEIGFDGHWRSPTGFHIVVEVKTTEVYAIKTATLVGYVDELISERLIPNWESALGLYVVGRPDPELHSLENSILSERRSHQLRIISVTALLLLAEMMRDYDVGHEELLTIVRPSRPTVDPLVDLMSRLVLQREAVETPAAMGVTTEPERPRESGEGPAYWFSPVKGDQEQTADQVIETLVGRERIYAYGDRTPGRKSIKPGDWICFYATGKGVIAHAEVASLPENKPHPRVRHPEKYPWVFSLRNPTLYLDRPVVLDAATRARMDAFKQRDPGKSWSWFAQATRRISEHDFRVLTRQESSRREG